MSGSTRTSENRAGQLATPNSIWSKPCLRVLTHHLKMVLLATLVVSQNGWCANEFEGTKGPHAQSNFLQSQAPDIPPDTFREFADALKSAGIVTIKGSTTEINKTRLNPVCNRTHKLTFSELFETLARQTKSTPHYDATSDSWDFKSPPMPLPYSLSIASGWICEDRGQYTCYIPKVAPVGMDIYMLGRFKNLNDQELIEVRDEQALWFADRVKPGVTLTEMKKAIVDGCEALAFECPAPIKGRQWRQWALAKNMQTFVIVSAVSDENEKVLMPDVQSMLASFHVLKPVDPFLDF